MRIVIAVVVIGLVLLTGVGICAWLVVERLPALEKLNLTAALSEKNYNLQTSYHTEEEWIVSTVCRNSFEMLSFAADKKGEVIPPENVTVVKVEGDTDSYEVTLRSSRGTVKATLQWPGSIWSSSAYVPFCQAAADQLKLAKPSSEGKAQGYPLKALLDFSEKTIESENQRVSQWLNQEPDNPAAHEQAALVLGTLAMKENSGWFWDPRDICNHVSAHLAVARWYRGSTDVSAEGRLAECQVGLIADTKKECREELDQLDKLSSSSTDIAAWVRAGRLRNSRDWRILEKPETGSAMEQVEYFRALCEAVDPDRAIEWLRKQPDDSSHNQDWIRLVLQGTFSVEAGHVFAKPSIAGELQLMQATCPGRFKSATLIADLNEAPEDVLGADASGGKTLKVISDGAWGHYFQRHLCHVIAETGNFLQSKWGVPDQTREFDQAINKTFTGMCLFPYLQIVNQHLRQAPENQQAVLAAFVQHPEWAGDFVCEIEPTRGLDMAQYRQLVRHWFSPAFPSGTAYAAFSRFYNVAEPMKTDAAAMGKLYAIAPLQFKVAELDLKARYSAHPTYQQVQEVMGSMVDYYMPALDLAAKASDCTLDQRLDLYRKAAGMDPDYHLKLAEALIQAGGRDKEAAQAYQNWYDKATNRVYVANKAEWLVTYYYEHDQKDKALEIAKAGAEVYSNSGLATMMRLMEKMDRVSEAEEYGAKIKERYDDSAPLIALYKRQADKGDAAYRAKFDEVLRGVFPSGLKAVTLASFTSPPDAGMRFQETTDSMTQNGLSSHQVVVALDGYRVENVAQYTFVRELSVSPTMKLIVWDGSGYREISANQPGRRFGVDMQNYSH